MKLKQLTVAGFRGFNTERTIDFHDKLTVVGAANSHGKTSISEALEFLIYGATSKVEKADSKDEYKDSYRNRHFSPQDAAYIHAVFVDAGNMEKKLRVELDADGTIRRFVDGKSVETWPFQTTLLTAARPFVLQHALKYLLLVPPSDRFQGFANLLGLNDLDGAFQAIVSLCTKPNASLPPEGQRLLNELDSLEAQIKTVAELKKVATNINKGTEGLDEAYLLIEKRADALLGGVIKPEERHQKLIEARKVAAAKIYSGEVAIQILTEADVKKLNSDYTTLSTGVNAAFLEDYGRLCVQGVTARLQTEAKLLNLGVELLTDNPNSCPLCAQLLNDALRRGIHERYASAKGEIERSAAREECGSRVTRTLLDLKKALNEYTELSESQISNLVVSMQPENAQKVSELLGGPSTPGSVTVRVAAESVGAAMESLRTEAVKVNEAILMCESRSREKNHNLTDTEALGKTILSYVTKANELVMQISSVQPGLTGPAATLRQAVDALAGTSEISLLIELFETRTKIRRALRLRDLLEGLKDLKRLTEQTLAETMEVSMNTGLTSSVMKWYERIRTDGDPDVHFSGFAMERTKSGDFKSRRLAVKANSYGVELASAVSSLSESKLNALGLCVSIASAIRFPGPWRFLIIDDPIQSWDDEHETRFIDVIRSLVENENKQVVVLSHKTTWTKRVCQGCRTLNGVHYEITKYTKDGPNLAVMEWSPIDQRLREAEAIASDPTATSVKLQQGEQEIRLAANQLASQVAKEKLGRVTSAHNMNSKDVRAILIEAGVTSELVDRIYAACVTADEAHHAPKNYEPNAQRIRQELAAIREVMKQTKNI